ncbi:hypothetical protein ABZ208_27880 [Streptomyces sp. NPDC006208]|uniref:hypothetical protein n=1 Tax=Streptomyces sp. NPDC006208 TaxID=3156734 RepID=UPI0033B64C24
MSSRSRGSESASGRDPSTTNAHVIDVQRTQADLAAAAAAGYVHALAAHPLPPDPGMSHDPHHESSYDPEMSHEAGHGSHDPGMSSDLSLGGGHDSGHDPGTVHAPGASAIDAGAHEAAVYDAGAALHHA